VKEDALQRTWVDPADLPAELDISEAARADRLDRQLAGMRRQLERRIAEVEQLRARLGEEPTPAGELARKAAEYDALMRTKTMRLLAYPRVQWGRLLAARDTRRSRLG
jgi:hypothetical protein